MYRCGRRSDYHDGQLQQDVPMKSTQVGGIPGGKFEEGEGASEYGS